MPDFISMFWNLEAREKPLVRFLAYVVRRGGTPCWAVLYAWMMWRAWNVFGELERLVLLIAGLVIAGIALAFEWGWGYYQAHRIRECENVRAAYGTFEQTMIAGQPSREKLHDLYRAIGQLRGRV
jgi:hypothetical protein